MGSISIFASLFGFMLIPVWIPLVGATVGRIADAVRARRGLVAEPTVVERLRARRAAEAATAVTMPGPTPAAPPLAA